ncbi:hypothetical protein ACIQRW_00565 [Streptomyces sp. NPDC091287]|uniref:hypothetical protein n=1 Tax=Streptomyces sp. NPDC091287 TaxID=3365988 RepID=UPI0038307A66
MAGLGGESAQAGRSGDLRKAERRAGTVADAQNLQSGMGGGLDAVEVPVADPGQSRRFIRGSVTAFFPHPAQVEIGEGVGHQLGAEALFVIDQDDLPEGSGRARSEVDSELFSELPAARRLPVNQWRFRGWIP